MFNILLQLLDDGRLTDNQGRTVDFKNTIVIMTSNLGSIYLYENIRQDGTIDEDVKEKVLGEMRSHFRPEFINRIDDTIIFAPLSEEQIVKIIDLSVKELADRLADREIKIEILQGAEKHIADVAYTPQYGARPVKRYIQQEVETNIAKLIIEGKLEPGDTVVVGCVKNELTYDVKRSS